MLSDRAASLIVTGRSARFADRCATAIADLSIRECEYLDELYLLNTPRISDPARKRHHRLFLSELLAFYFCEIELLLRRNVPGITDRMLAPAVEMVARRATFDPVLDAPPHFISDLMPKRYERYKRRIDTARSRLNCDIRDGDLARGAAREIAGIVLSDYTLSVASHALASQIEKRLEWTRAELVGLPN